MADAKSAREKTTATVVWAAANTFEERTLRPVDFKRLGAEDADMDAPPVVWGQHNEWKVPRSALPLDDAQLADLMRRDPKFSVRG